MKSSIPECMPYGESPGAQEKASCSGSSDDICNEHDDSGDSGINGVVSVIAMVTVIWVFFFSSQWDGKDGTDSSVPVFCFHSHRKRVITKEHSPSFPLTTLLTDFRVKTGLI